MDKKIKTIPYILHYDLELDITNVSVKQGDLITFDPIEASVFGGIIVTISKGYVIEVKEENNKTIISLGIKAVDLAGSVND